MICQFESALDLDSYHLSIPLWFRYHNSPCELERVKTLCFPQILGRVPNGGRLHSGAAPAFSGLDATGGAMWAVSITDPKYFLSAKRDVLTASYSAAGVLGHHLS